VSIGKISEQDIRAWTGETSFKRGLSYFNDGAIFQTQRQGNTLKARCEGSGDEAYWVSAVVEKSVIRSSDCSCPVGPSCKHVAALLLTWLHEPQEFEETEPPEDMLRRLSPEALIQLVLKMLALQPSLETLLIAKSARPGGKAMNAESLLRQIRTVFRQSGYGYGASEEVAGNLRMLLENAREYRAAADWPAVITICSLLAQEISATIGEMEDGDEGGDLRELADESVAVLGACLEPLQADPEQRRVLLRALFDMYYRDLDDGGMLEQPHLILTQQTTADDAELLGQWLRAALNTLSDGWKRQACARLLLALQGKRMDQAEAIQICRQYGLVEEAIRRLLNAGEVEAAAEDWRRLDGHRMVATAHWFVEAGHAELAEREMRRQLDLWEKDEKKQQQLPLLWNWQLERAEQRDDVPQAALWSETLFRDNPGLHTYQKLKKWSCRAGTWDSLRPQLLEWLKQQARLSDTLIRIYLTEEQDIASALQIHAQAQQRSSLSLELAKAAEAEYPESALAIYLNAAKSQIELRGRDHYTAAAGHLTRVRQLYQKLGKEAEWQHLIRDIREKHRALRALREELGKAGL